ncbi:hypothetical protein DVH24_000270 [Malus domestica]|uniref:Uncharacterized protein n=1 Tax=Malus domestica TaxID=3750 RepID=A0A498J5D1_MALDO|nr:hypothetical protein DVH24_000270 [Malus domestica]
MLEKFLVVTGTRMIYRMTRDISYRVTVTLKNLSTIHMVIRLSNYADNYNSQVNIDKNTENDLQMVTQKGSDQPLRSRKSIPTRPLHNILGDQGGVEERVLSECCREMDASFLDHCYVVSRISNSIGPLEL